LNSFMPVGCFNKKCIDCCKFVRNLNIKISQTCCVSLYVRCRKSRVVAYLRTVFRYNGKLSRDKMSRDKMSRDKMSCDKMSRDKMSLLEMWQNVSCQNVSLQYCLLPKCLFLKCLFTILSPTKNVSSPFWRRRPFYMYFRAIWPNLT
jgi:hypothetical protein